MERQPITNADPGDEHIPLGEMPLAHWYTEDGRLRNGDDESPDIFVVPGTEEACELEGQEF